jgi:hypothetical protein
MNDAGRDALVKAALAGVRQIEGAMRDHDGGQCAFEVLSRASRTPYKTFALSRKRRLCSECDFWMGPEADYIIHLNDAHHWTFLDIARKV